MYVRAAAFLLRFVRAGKGSILVGGVIVRTMRIVALASVAVMPSPSAVSAQLEISPSIGFYVPHGANLLKSRVQQGDRFSLRKKAVGGPVFTTRLSAWVTRHLGLEGTVAYSPALIAIHSTSGSVSDVAQHLVLASARSVLRINPDSLRKSVNIHVASGVGIVSRTGAAWEDTPPVSPSVAFVLAAGGQTRLGRTVLFRFELEDYVSWIDFQEGQHSTRLYHDLIWSLGLGIPIGRH
jgi:hypothetical protein